MEGLLCLLHCCHWLLLLLHTDTLLLLHGCHSRWCWPLRVRHLQLLLHVQFHGGCHLAWVGIIRGSCCSCRRLSACFVVLLLLLPGRALTVAPLLVQKCACRSI